MPTLAVEAEVELYYEDYGTGQPVVFIHGGGLSHEMWEQQVYTLTDHYRTITYDQRAHGQSSKPGHGHDFETFTNDLEVLLTQRQVDHCHLVCHGIGAYVGLTFSLRHPTRVHGLVLAGSGSRFLGRPGQRGGFSPEQWQAYMQGMAANKIESVHRLVNNGFYYKDPGAATRQAVIDTMLQWPIYATKMLGHALQATDLGSRVGALAVPVIVAHGVHDIKQPFSGAQELAAALPGAHLQPFTESAHNPQLEEVEKFNQMLLDFFAQTAST